MTLAQIKSAVQSGKSVYWCNNGYRVVLDSIGQWLIVWGDNNSAIGLTHSDGQTLNGNPSDFFIG